MEDICVTCKEANIEATEKGIIELIVSVDAGQKDGLLDNFTARDAIRHFGEDELLVWCIEEGYVKTEGGNNA